MSKRSSKISMGRTIYVAEIIDTVNCRTLSHRWNHGKTACASFSKWSPYGRTMLSLSPPKRCQLFAVLTTLSLSMLSFVGTAAARSSSSGADEPSTSTEPASTSLIRKALDSVPTRWSHSLESLVKVELYDYNYQQYATLAIARDGSVSAQDAAQVKQLFKCRRSKRQHTIDSGTLAMLADVGARYPGKVIEFVSAYRNFATESKTSPHRAGRAIDFRVRGARQTEVRDYLWRSYTNVGIGWYPKEDFVHVDHRPGEKDISWTELKGKNIYNPSWADAARDPDRSVAVRRQPGV
jgi:uncharacterized protein YcbK (DUF882 family)